MPEADVEHPAIPPRAVIFDLGGTLVEWPDEDPAPRWTTTHRRLGTVLHDLPGEDAFVRAMVEAEQAHWDQVVAEQWSGPPSGLVREGFRRLGRKVGETELLAVLDAYAGVVEGWSTVCPDAPATLEILRARDYRLGLLSNTWWAAEWHDAELATHGLAPFLDEVVYTSDLECSKPHPSVFLAVCERLGVEPAACIMVGDRMLDDIAGALDAGMRAVWKRNDRPWPKPEGVRPSATIDRLAELPAILRSWGGR